MGEPTKPLEVENLAQTLKRELPAPHTLGEADGDIAHVAVPQGWKLEIIDDNEKIGDGPRRTIFGANLTEPDSFIDYVKKHAVENTVVWCAFDPLNLLLSFKAVIDEHGNGQPGWRAHIATFTPRLAVEWAAWASINKKELPQSAFATFLEDHEDDIIAAVDGYPSSLQVKKMALEFEARSEQRIKSKISLNDGSVALEFFDGTDAATVEKMKIFERFALGLPVFWRPPAEDGAPITAYRLDARLRYNSRKNPPMFWIDLVRPDLVHQKASMELIREIADGIDSPMLMGF